MRNMLRNDQARSRKAQRVFRRHDELVKIFEPRPDQEAARKEWLAKVRFVVFHVLSADDRKLLSWYYWDGMTAGQIGGQLRISEAAVLQRLVRARRRFHQEFEK